MKRALGSIFEVKVILSDQRAGAILSLVLSPEVPEPPLTAFEA